ncbi:GNAT family N-acetyltransferase [Brachybacterium sp. EF45031]|uniref:GNAT family N-acetyltransferase n=1 Tax=Brachybacterium sillae TaxID=2810536 RepID=UPI00217F0D33|nr:GNAT family N-acetyltransferase [Brachybacterium sillae]MCS6712343.1 GNAT family N-acetyltransferase [Brachybacterium sillae]
MLRGRGPRVRPVRVGATADALRRLAADPAQTALAGTRLEELSHSAAVSREFSQVVERGADPAVLWHGVNVFPVGITGGDPATQGTARAFADLLLGEPLRASSLVGPRAEAEALWGLLAPVWEPRVREYRWSQPVLEALAEPRVDPHPGLRPAVAGEADLVAPAAIAMFREEVGVDPTARDGGLGYRARVRWLVESGRTYVVEQAGTVVFKADVGAVFSGVAQIHGVWTHPQLRGRGLARAAMAALVPMVRRDHAPRVCLYVNDFNEPARRAYTAAGFDQVGELSTILF